MGLQDTRIVGTEMGTRGGNVEALVGRSLADIERELVLATLTRCGGNRTWAADMLGLPPLVLRDKLLQYRRQDEAHARDVARREALLTVSDGPVMPTHVPSANFAM